MNSSEQYRPQKRKRTVISCSECHRRKQKCDRESPCCNCIKRGTQNLCHYDADQKNWAPTQSSSGESSRTEMSATSSMNLFPPAPLDSACTGEFQEKVRNFGYSTHGNHNSMSLLRTTEVYGGQDISLTGSIATDGCNPGDQANRKFRELVRQLPPQACIHILLQTFFSAINWQYDLLDEEYFRESLNAWERIPYSDLQAGFQKLTHETRVFPALLFQVFAQALLFHPPHDEIIGSLITMPGMTFHDLAIEYSDIGAEIVVVLGKKDISIATVQASLLRASFLKSSGKVVEAWHVLGATIRDAQEIGLHTGRIDSDRSPDRAQREGQNPRYVGHKVWVVLHIWDVHMAVVLGRPIATDLQIDRFASSIEDEEMRRGLFSHWQTETGLPRPFDIILAGYNVAYRYFKDIHHIEHNGANHQDYPTIERIDTAIKANLEGLPSWCRLQNPNTRFDQTNGCQWLPVAREGLSSLIHLVLLTLHRPYIFSVHNSRTEALEAGLCILRAQDRLFQQSEPHHHKVFNPVYASFDAIVLIAAVCLVFPNEDHKRQLECIDAVEKGMKRLGIIGQSNGMAKSAHSIVCSLYHRLRHRLGVSQTPQTTETFLSNSDYVSPTSNTHRIINPHDSILPEVLFDGMLPPRPTHDLFFDHISSTPMPSINTPDTLPLDPLLVDVADAWNFQGVFSDASFWSFMNEFN